MATVPTVSPLWQASSEAIDNSNLSAYQRFIKGEHGVAFENYQQLHQWSVDNSEDFWESIWQFTGVIASRRYDNVLDNAEAFPGAQWFPGAELNFAENLLRYAQRDDAASKIAIVARLENGERRELSYAELYVEVENSPPDSKRLALRWVIASPLLCPMYPRPLSPCSPLPASARCGPPAHPTLALMA